MSLMGLDIGTSGCKALVMSEDGKIITQEGESYTVNSLRPGCYELDPAQVWRKVILCIQRSNAACKNDPVTAISFSSQGEAIIPVDSMMHPLDVSPVSADMRGLKYVEELRALVKEHDVFSITGQLLDPIHSIFKIRWWVDNEERIRKTCWKYCCFDTYVLLCLGLPPVTDRSMAARMMLYDVQGQSWSKILLDFAGINEGQLPEIINSGSVIGTLSNDVSSHLGFSVRPQVISGGHDQPCSAFGNGLIDHGTSYSVGTTECISIIQKDEDNKRIFGFPSYPHVCPGATVTLIGSQTGTRFFSWLGNILLDSSSHNYKQRLENFYDFLRSVPDDIETDVIVIPHLSGGSSYYENPHAKALMYGFSYDTHRNEFLKAAMEGITFEQYLSFSRFKRIGELQADTGAMIAAGGGSRFKNWLYMKADIFRIPIQLMSSHEAGCIGAAMLAGVGSQVFLSAEEAVECCVKKGELLVPRDKLAAYYSQKIQRYDLLYRAVDGLTQ